MPPQSVVRRRRKAEEADARGHTVLTLVSQHISSGTTLARLSAFSRGMRASLPVPRDMPPVRHWEAAAARDAARTGRLPALRWILSIDPLQAHGGGVLHVACAAGQLACARLLITAGADVNQRDGEENHTPLYDACLAGETRCAELLLAAGATPSEAVLIAACEGGNAECVTLLLSCGIAPNAKGALTKASEHGHLQCVHALLERYGALEHGDDEEHEWGWEMADAAQKACKGRHMPCVTTLLQHGDHEDVLTTELVRAACADGNLSFLQMLGDEGEEFLVDELDHMLDAALEADHAHVVSWILGMTADRDREWLKWPLRNNSPRCLRLLLENQVPVVHDQALRMACEHGSLECAALLLQHTTTPVSTQTLRAVLFDAPRDVAPLVEMLLERGADPNPNGLTDDAPVLIASRRSDPESLERLLAAGGAAPGGALSLHVSETREAIDCLELQLAHGSTSEALRERALLGAARVGLPRSVERLLAAGVDPNAEMQSESPLLAACTALPRRRVQTVHALLVGGSRRHIERALCAAVDAKDPELLALLLREVGPAELHAAAPCLNTAVGLDAGECVRLLLRKLQRLDPAAAAVKAQDALRHACAAGKKHASVSSLLLAGAVPTEWDLEKAIECATDDRLVRTLLRAGAPVRRVLSSSALVHLSQALVWELVRAGGPTALEWRDSEGRTPLFTWCALRRLSMASHARAVGIVRQLLLAGADANASDEHGTTPLHVAAQEGDAVVVHLLVHAGADVNAVDRGGATPLMGAAMRCRYPCMRALLDAGAALDQRDAHGRSALTLAAAAAAAHKESDWRHAVRMLRNAGASALDGPSRQALETVAREEATAMLAAVQGELLRLRVWMAEQPAAADLRDVLLVACVAGQPECAALLLELGGTPADSGDSNPDNLPLVAACKYGHVGCVARLLEHGGAHRPAVAQKALEAACGHGAVRCVEVLLAHGVRPTADALWLARGCALCVRLCLRGQAADLAAAAAARERLLMFDPGCLELLLAHGADPNALDEAALRPLLAHAVENGAHAASVELLLEWGANADARDAHGRTALDAAIMLEDEHHIAALANGSAYKPLTRLVQKRRHDCLRALLKAAPWRVHTAEAQDALREACACHGGAAVSVLLDLGVRPDDETAWLVLAIHHGARAVAVETLLDAGGVDLERRDDALEHGLMPLHLAAYRGEAEVVCLLLRRGADVRATCAPPPEIFGSADGAASALLLAIAGAHAHVVRLLLRHGALVHPFAVELSVRKDSKECLEALPAEALHLHATSTMLRTACSSRSWSCVAPLLRAGAVDEEDERGGSALREACQGGSEAAAAIRRLLAVSTLGPNARREALVHACAHPDDDGATVLKLLASGASPSRAALQEAARNGNRRCLRALLETQACEVDETALRHASASDDHECVRLLLDAGAQPVGATLAATSDALIARTLLDLLPASVSVDEALRAACARGAAAMVWELLRSREPSAGAWHGALVAACASGSAVCVQLVLARAGAGVASVAALHASTSAACTRLLLEHVPVDASDHEGTTALMAASARGDLEVVRVLIDREASLQGAALRLAVQHGHAPVVRELLYVGAAVPDDADGVELQGECAAVLHDARHDGTFAGRRREW